MLSARVISWGAFLAVGSAQSPGFDIDVMGGGIVATMDATAIILVAALALVVVIGGVMYSTTDRRSKKRTEAAETEGG